MESPKRPRSTGAAQVVPLPDFSPEEAVRVQMTAIQQNDTPWPNHGIQTMYEFAADAGGMERSRYFGFSKDLYHFDHFLGAFLNTFPDFVACRKFSIGGMSDYDADLKRIEVAVVDRHGADCGPFAFLLVQNKRGCWMTKVILRKPLE